MRWFVHVGESLCPKCGGDGWLHGYLYNSYGRVICQIGPSIKCPDCDGKGVYNTQELLDKARAWDTRQQPSGQPGDGEAGR